MVYCTGAVSQYFGAVVKTTVPRITPSQEKRACVWWAFKTTWRAVKVKKRKQNFMKLPFASVSRLLETKEVCLSVMVVVCSQTHVHIWREFVTWTAGTSRAKAVKAVRKFCGSWSLYLAAPRSNWPFAIVRKKRTTIKSPHYHFPRGKIRTRLIYGGLLWAYMNAATALGAWGCSVSSLVVYTVAYFEWKALFQG